MNVRVIAVGDNRGSLVATFTKRHVEGHLTEQRNTKFVGQLLTTTGTEDVVTLAVVADEPTHVFDDTTNGQLELASRVGRPLGHALSGSLRCRNDVHLNAGNDFAQGQCDIARAGRHVNQQKVGLVPPGFGDQLLDGLVQHGATPDDGLLVGHEVTH